MNYNLTDQYVIIIASGVPHRVNFESATFSMPNPRYSRKSDNTSGKVTFTEAPNWREFDFTLNVPQSDKSNDFLRQAMGITVSMIIKDANGTMLVHANQSKINFDTMSLESEPGQKTWTIIGTVAAFNPGSNGDLDFQGLIPEIPDLPKIF